VFFPSVRWLSTALGAWALLLAIASLGAVGVSASRPRLRLLGLAAVLAPLASLLPFLATLYADDESFHLTVAGATAPARLLTGYVFALSLGAAALVRLFRRPLAPSVAVSHETADTDLDLQPRSAAGAALWWGSLGVTAMTLLNLGFFGPLASREAGALPGATLVIGNLLALGGAAWLGAGGTKATALLSVVLLGAWLAFAPVVQSIPTTTVGLALLAGVLGLLAVERGQGRLAQFAGLALVGVALAVAWLSAGAFVSSDHTLAPFWSSPHEGNGALGAAFSRLYAGAGALTAASVPPVAAAEALGAGTSLCAATLLLWFLWAERPLAGVRAVVAACLALLAVVGLWPVAPITALALAAVALVPVCRPALWRALAPSHRRWVAGFAIAGYVLAGTSIPALSQAATELLSRWPPLASLPSLGLILLALALVLALHHDQRGARAR
jgi:hypothetical protein